MSSSLVARKRPSKNSVLTFGGDLRPIVLYVTVCSFGRAAVFDNPKAVKIFLQAFAAANLWSVGRYVVMPDHIHFFCWPTTSPPSDFHRWIKYWKACVTRIWQGGPRFCAAVVPDGADARKRVPPVFQRECWDVQMRDAAHYAEKMNYVLGNPVRKGLVSRWEDWPYQGEVMPFVWQGR